MSTIAELYNQLKERDQKIKALVADNETLMKKNAVLKQQQVELESLVLSINTDRRSEDETFFSLRSFTSDIKVAIYKRKQLEQMPYQPDTQPTYIDLISEG